ncbi:VOC family protein [Streptosporangiaceae bacterium NEAU-GS5]|nr:VOC family protein [Streptosporangiaceae bacterium NEAU-GS5]
MAIAELRSVVLDCPEPRKLADFYAGLLGWKVTYEDDDWVSVRTDGGAVGLSFQRAPDYQPPTWPDPERPQQFHLDVTVDDIDKATSEVIALGAVEAGHQPGLGENWRVFLDPAGHPFCLCWG